MSHLSRILYAATFVALGCLAWLLWVKYNEFALTGGAEPIRLLIENEMARFEAASRSGKTFKPSACSGNCQHDFLQSYSATEGGEMLFLFRGHPDLDRKTLRYRPSVRMVPTTADGTKAIWWTCESNIEWPALSRFPVCI